jgi:hypothetical protein
MVANKKNTQSKKRPASKTKVEHPAPAPAPAKAWYRRGYEAVLLPSKKLKRRVQELLVRRPHRSFRNTRRRDYVRSLKLPGYWSFTAQVRRILWQHRKTFGLLVLAYGILSVVFVGMASQDIYSELGDLLRSSSGELFKGNWGEIGKAGLMLASSITGSMSETLTPAQQIYGMLLALLTWLTTVWLLRAILAGRRPRLRDGLYNSGAPILPTFFVSLLLSVQLLPIGVAAVGFGAALGSNLLDGGVEAMLFWTCAVLLGTLSLYWISSTLIAMVVVTLPGMYPMQAIKTAGDLVVGRRVRILLRVLWLLLIVAVVWLVIMIPIILFDTWIKGIIPAIVWVPIVPVVLMTMSVLTVLWSASYIYMLYRKVVDDDAAPA